MHVDALLINRADNVATAIRDLRAKDIVKVALNKEILEIKALSDIPYGHKIAIKKIRKGEKIIKYGEAIGKAVKLIAKGSHSHIHNIESLRGRGDLQEG
jgi:altronate dehydratase small subunit